MGGTQQLYSWLLGGFEFLEPHHPEEDAAALTKLTNDGPQVSETIFYPSYAFGKKVAHLYMFLPHSGKFITFFAVS